MLIWPPLAARVGGRWLSFLVSLWRQEGRGGVGNGHWVTSQPPTCHPFPAHSEPSFCFVFSHGTNHLLIVYFFLFSYVILFLPLEESSSLPLYLQQLAQSWLLLDDKKYQITCDWGLLCIYTVITKWSFLRVKFIAVCFFCILSDHRLCENSRETGSVIQAST